jgi:hypothetical protein
MGCALTMKRPDFDFFGRHECTLKGPRFSGEVLSLYRLQHSCPPRYSHPATIQAHPCEPELAWSHPPHPDQPTYQKDLEDMEAHLARSQQLHACKRNTCLTVFDPKTCSYLCQRRAPFSLAVPTTVTDQGKVKPQRTHGYFDNWNPTVLIYGHCNKDIKLLTNGVKLVLLGGISQAIRPPAIDT